MASESEPFRWERPSDEEIVERAIKALRKDLRRIFRPRDRAEGRGQEDCDGE